MYKRQAYDGYGTDVGGESVASSPDSKQHTPGRNHLGLLGGDDDAEEQHVWGGLLGTSGSNHLSGFAGGGLRTGGVGD